MSRLTRSYSRTATPLPSPTLLRSYLERQSRLDHRDRRRRPRGIEHAGDRKVARAGGKHQDAAALIAVELVHHLAQPGAIEHHLRSEEHTSELQPLMRLSYAVFCLKKNMKE